MNKKWLAFLIFLVFGSTANADMKLSINGGVGIPTGDTFVADFYQYGYGGGLGIEGAINDNLSWAVKGNYLTFSLNEHDFENLNKLVDLKSGGGASFTEFVVGAKYKLNKGFVSPYGYVGVGFGVASLNEITTQIGSVIATIPSSSDTELAYEASIGVDIGPVFIEGGITKNNFPFRAGVRF